MSKLTATIHGFYVKNGKNVYRYLVNGTDEALKAYEEAQGSNYREYENENDDTDKLNGTPLFFSTRPEGKTINLAITPNGKVIIDKDVMLVMEQSMVYEEKVQEKLAEIDAKQRAIRLKLVGQQ